MLGRIAAGVGVQWSGFGMAMDISNNSGSEIGKPKLYSRFPQRDLTSKECNEVLGIQRHPSPADTEQIHVGLRNPSSCIF